MIFKKDKKQQIDHEQIALFKNAQARMTQKKGLFVNFVFFFIICGIALIANLFAGLGQEFTLLNIPWSVILAITWALLLIYHTISVYIINKFMGKDWEEKQLSKLVEAQKKRIKKLKINVEKNDQNKLNTAIINNKMKTTVPNLTLIVATGKANEIGKNNDLIWHLRDDLKRFKALTSGHHIIMGRKTFESFPKPLPNRTHIVITRQSDYKAPEGVIIVNSLIDALNAIKNDDQPFIIGGGEIYKQALPYIQKMELTKVHANFDADTFFPDFDASEWNETQNTLRKADEKHKHDFSFVTLERK